MLRLFKKKVQQKPKDFTFSKTGYILSSETCVEYEYIKKLFFISMNVLLEKSADFDGKKEIKKLISYYEKSDTLMGTLLNEIFSKKFIETIDKRLSLFELLDKIFRMFYLFDKHRFNNVKLFHNFSFFKMKNRKCIDEKEVVKCSTFSSIAMPMGRLFLSYFTSENYEIFHPVILKKRTTLFINDTKKEYLRFVCSIVVDHTEFKYLKMYLCGLYEKMFKDARFDYFYNSLSIKEKAYYVDLIELI
jgi:hypothetical protein